MKIKTSYLLIGAIAIVGVIVVVGLKKGWFHSIIHYGEKPRTTPPDFTDRDALGTRPVQDIPIPLITDQVRKSVYNGV